MSQVLINERNIAAVRELRVYPARYRSRFCNRAACTFIPLAIARGSVTAACAFIPLAIARGSATSMTRREFNDDQTPLGYLITFRTYGTWMHGDKRGSVDYRHRMYETPILPPSSRRKQIESRLLKQPAVRLDSSQRTAIDHGVRETCMLRKWELWALNIWSNHVHCVVTDNMKPRSVMTALKANATRAMREADCWRNDLSPWARGGSKKYLWTEDELMKAVTYVVEEQGEPLT
jgi:REP element-mobilizing transposase RayT